MVQYESPREIYSQRAKNKIRTQKLRPCKPFAEPSLFPHPEGSVINASL